MSARPLRRRDVSAPRAGTPSLARDKACASANLAIGPLVLAALVLQSMIGSAVAQAPKRELAPLSSPKIALVPFENSPFPYRGDIPEKNKPFIDVVEGDRLGHTSLRGGVYWEDQTYSDRRSLLYIPRGFDPRRPALIVVFLHGNDANLTRDVRNRQQVPRQLAESGLNAVLVAPQFAVNALDSSAGRFWDAAAFPEFLKETTERLTELHGNEKSRGAFFDAPVILVAYSGGYNPAAFILQAGRTDQRLRGVILLDALYGEVDKFADWLARRTPAFFVSAYGKAARGENTALQRMLTERNVPYQTTVPASLTRGSVSFLDTTANDTIRHVDFVTQAWVADPLKLLLRRISGFARTGAPIGSAQKSK